MNIPELMRRAAKDTRGMAETIYKLGGTYSVWSERAKEYDAAAAEMETHSDLEAMLITDNKAMKSAGGKLAEAAMRVVREGDGLHRLSLAVSEWAQVQADEGGRSDRHSPAPVVPEGYAIVPIEPTEAMMEAYNHAFVSKQRFDGAEVYKAMLKAAPENYAVPVVPEALTQAVKYAIDLIGHYGCAVYGIAAMTVLQDWLSAPESRLKLEEGRWVHCSPDLLRAGVDCDKTPRRPCECSVDVSHDHFISHTSPEPDGGEMRREFSNGELNMILFAVQDRCDRLLSDYRRRSEKTFLDSAGLPPTKEHLDKGWELYQKHNALVKKLLDLGVPDAAMKEDQ